MKHSDNDNISYTDRPNYMYGDVGATGMGTTLPEPTVTVSRYDYESAKDAESFLNALIAAGVNNWEGYEQALEIYKTFS